MLEQTPAVQALREWRLERARADEVPAYVVFHNPTLAEIAGAQPRTLAELAAVPGVGPAKLERYGGDVLAALVARSTELEPRGVESRDRLRARGDDDSPASIARSARGDQA